MKQDNLNSLRVFAVVARCGNRQRAAEEMNLSRGAVSQRIKQLEIDLGIVLLERKARGVIHLGWTTMSRFAPIQGFPLAALVVARGTPFIDIRPIADVIAFANLPLVTRDGSVAPKPSGSGSCVSLTASIDMVEKLGARIANDLRPGRST